MIHYYLVHPTRSKGSEHLVANVLRRKGSWVSTIAPPHKKKKKKKQNKQKKKKKKKKNWTHKRKKKGLINDTVGTIEKRGGDKTFVFLVLTPWTK